jgi:hypothetical protein
MRHVIDPISNYDSVGPIFIKKSVTNLGAKIYNKLPNYIKNQENPRSFKKQLKTFLLHQTFYSVDEYLSYN